MSMNELWNNVKPGPPDAYVRAAHSRILALADMYAKDTSEKKANLGIGAYRDEHGKPWILPAVQMVRVWALIVGERAADQGPAGEP